MGQENLEQNQYPNKEERIEPKIRVSRDGRWIIMNVPGIEQPIIKSVNYFKAIIENAEKKMSEDLGPTLRKLKELEENGKGRFGNQGEKSCAGNQGKG
jgi:hypothetical protein